ncbi:MAG: PilZ domain-containing protein [Deltaproteobacteria bacterium]|nr:PilZ domain-containing protein [Deltaproteobacteria bacterium]
MNAPVEVLLLHDGELSDVAALLGEFEVEWLEVLARGSQPAAAPLLIGTPARLLRFELPGGPDSVARIAICDGAGAGKTLRRKLEAHGVDFVLRRPVHPAALRLLVLHMIYRGPERRRLRRVNATIPVRYRVGWKARQALLLEFSVGGCSLLMDRVLTGGKRIKVFLPEELGLGRKLGLKGHVVRSEAAASGQPGEQVVAIDLGELPPDAHQRLAAGVVSRARKTAAPIDVPKRGGPEPIEALDEVSDGGERRRLPRGIYTKAVHGRVDGAQLVLMGTNLSPKGMQVDPEPRVELGASLKLDLYGHGDIPPLRLEARVARDDGERGLYLEFVRLWPGAPAVIERLIKTLPLVAPGEGRMVISEVVESDPLGRPRS